MSSVSVICDFDGTITTADVGHALCEAFAPGALARVDALWHAGEISFHEAFRRACSELDASRAQIVEHALTVGRLREGFLDLVETCHANGVDLFVSSAGLDLYIDPILERDLGAGRHALRYHVNEGRIGTRGIDVHFPHRHADCDECGNCKGLLADRLRESGRSVVAVGDSVSDRCLVGRADHLFARGWLAEHCRRAGVDHRPFDDFSPVSDLVENLASRDAAE